MSTIHKITIAIDGFSSCGKSTLAKALAKKLSYIFIDSGAMYRGVTLFCMQNNLFDQEGNPIESEIIGRLGEITLDFRFNNNTQQSDLWLNGQDVEQAIRMPDVASKVSKVASIKEVRNKLVKEQRKMGTKGGIVMDGRDIGSVVFPNAELKLFVTASPKIRAERRLLELQSKNVATTFEEVLKNLEDRDLMDSTRAESPLVKTSDAITLDTSFLTPDEQLNQALELVLMLQNGKN